MVVGGDGAEASDGTRINELEKQLQVARNDLREAEKKLEAKHWVAPPSLQHWLQLTHELELRNYNAKKAIAEQQLQAAKEGVCHFFLLLLCLLYCFKIHYLFFPPYCDFCYSSTCI